MITKLYAYNGVKNSKLKVLDITSSLVLKITRSCTTVEPDFLTMNAVVCLFCIVLIFFSE